ncbi:[Fe-Fe] hydrogenase large subunit C-terminal domain-containing protein [Oscillospiraceae bacterium PP1C4]
MATFQELYQTLLAAAVRKNLPEAIEQIRKHEEYDPEQLNCLLNPQKYPLVWKTADCDCSAEECACVEACMFDAIHRKEGGRIAIDVTKCVGCSACVDSCRSKKLTASKDILPAMEAVRTHQGLVYALIAPAFLGQFSAEVTPGKLRSAFELLGFDGLVEVALFADILTLKEAFEFDKNIKGEDDYQLTSCCCPIWIAMIRKIYSQLIPHVPGSVSPMIACGRAIKTLHPDALTIFIGPCIAKKSEAREPDLIGAVDYVLTFQEVQDIFDAAGIKPANLEDKEKDHSSRAGRIYAHTGGVSEAVRSTVERLNPHRKIEVRTQQADGVPSCKQMVNEILEGKTNANFFEGMGCVGGCVGGPKRIIPTEEGHKNVVAYGEEAVYSTPIDNPYVIELLHRLQIDTVEQLLDNSDIFTRKL